MGRHGDRRVGGGGSEWSRASLAHSRSSFFLSLLPLEPSPKCRTLLIPGLAERGAGHVLRGGHLQHAALGHRRRPLRRAARRRRRRRRRRGGGGGCGGGGGGGDSGGDGGGAGAAAVGGGADHCGERDDEAARQ